MKTAQAAPSGAYVDPSPPGGVARPGRYALHWSLLLLSFLGFLVSFYLTLAHYRGTIPNCYVVHGCDVVQSSGYSVVLGVPIALGGTIFFALMSYLAVGLLAHRSRAVTVAYKALAFAGALAAVLLFLLQAVVLKAFCTYCLVVEAVLLLSWGGSLPVRARTGSGTAVRRARNDLATAGSSRAAARTSRRK